MIDTQLHYLEVYIFMKSKLCFLLALLMLGATACGEAAPSGSDTTAASGDTNANPEISGRRIIACNTYHAPS